VYWFYLIVKGFLKFLSKSKKKDAVGVANADKDKDQ
jgi:hypothetical protein